MSSERRRPQLLQFQSFKPLVVVVGSVEHGDDAAAWPGEPYSPGEPHWGQPGGLHRPRWGGRTAPQNQLACLTRAVNSCTRLYTERSSRMSRAILEVAWITVV